MANLREKEIREKLDILSESFQKFLYEDDDKFLENMKSSSLAGDDIARYRNWEWTQGVGLYGIWGLYKEFGDEKCLELLRKYYDRALDIGLPSENINTTAPLLTLSYMIKEFPDEKYQKICHDWAEVVMNSFPRTDQGGFQHITSDSVNEQELWDDTLFMTVLFLANMGEIEDNDTYRNEALYQFLVHIKYLTDKKTGLLFHGWSFLEKGNFAEALWGRGNCWFTIAVPEFLSIQKGIGDSDRKFILEALKAQIQALEEMQDSSGMWHTLVDDNTSYVESSATCGFGYGILKAVRMGLVDSKYKECGLKALDKMLSLIREDGTVEQVSYGTPMGRISKDFYKEIEIRPMPYGQALAILYLLEILKA